MDIIAHRGASHEAPENTLASVRLGWAQGADAVEVDVRQSRDGHIVVIHDAHTRRTAGVTRRVRAETLDELRALEVGRWKHRRHAGEKIPTLAEVIETVPPGKRLFVEGPVARQGRFADAFAGIGTGRQPGVCQCLAGQRRDYFLGGDTGEH